MKLLRSTLPLALALAVALPTTAWAQGRGNANGNKHKNKHEQRVIVIDRDDDDDDDHDPIRILNRDRDRDRVVVRDRDRDRFVLRNSGRTIILDDDDFFWYPVRSDRGPSFCRSGAGHPVFGIQWCLQKGYGIGRPGAVFFWGDDVFLRDQTRVIVLRDLRYDADQAFWSAVVGQVLALVD